MSKREQPLFTRTGDGGGGGEGQVGSSSWQESGGSEIIQWNSGETGG